MALNILKYICSKNIVKLNFLYSQQKRLIYSRDYRLFLNRPCLEPYPYLTKDYTFFNALFDKTSKRFDENSKLIIVEGSVAAGKDEFCKKLACQLDMRYFPDSTMNEIYFNSYGFDMRTLNDQLPACYRSFEIKDFYCDAYSPLSIRFQIQMYMLRYSNYINALAHILSTGQGVVMKRCCYSDYIFLEAMHSQNYISDEGLSVYYKLRDNTITELMKPHLIIYLDVPVDKIKERVQARCISYETNSEVLSEDYLHNIETCYKQYLKNISNHAELLIYDWSETDNDVDVVTEDVVKIDFDKFENYRHNSKMKDWRLPNEWDWCERRMYYTTDKADLMNGFNVPCYDAKELCSSGAEMKIFHDVWFNAPGMKYAKGYNQDMGDKELTFKSKLEKVFK